MPRFALYHNQLATFDVATTAYSSNPIAYVEAATPDEVFALTQHFEQPWFNNPAVHLCVRSTSVGDKIVDDRGLCHIVAPIGFELPRQSSRIEEVLANLQTMIEQRKVDATWLPVLAAAYELLQGANECPF